MYADFESILKRVHEAMDTTQGFAVGGGDPTPLGPLQENLPCSFAYKMVSSVIPEFTDAELRSFHTATNFHICSQPLGGDKVRDHCHIVGNYRGAAHSRCNLEYRISKFEWKLPVVMHNLKGYDGHLIVKALKSEFAGEVRVISQNMEKYLSITVDRLKFMDSLQFTPQSLDTGYMDSFARFDESRLLSQDAFFNKLSGSPCSDTDYAHATQVWTAFECESMADYHDIY